MKKRKSASVSIQFSSEKSGGHSFPAPAGYFLVLFSSMAGFVLTMRLLHFFTNEQEKYLLPCTFLYLCLVFFTLRRKRKFLFLFLLILPPSLNFFLSLLPSYLSLGFLLAAFLFWDFAVHPNLISYRNVFCTIFFLFLYAFCARTLTPALSPVLFKANTPLYRTVNRTLQHIETAFSVKPANSAPKPTYNAPVKIPFSYEQSTGTQTLNNSAPVYTNQTMFHFKCTSELNDPVYLRGFIGESYTEASWNASRKADWIDFLREHNYSDTTVNELFSIPYLSGKNQEEADVNYISITPEFTPKFTYLPYGAQMGTVMAGDNNEMPLYIPGSLYAPCIPLNLDSAHVLFNPAIPDTARYPERSYHDYALQHYTSWSSDSLLWLESQLLDLPVYASMPQNPSLLDIQNAAEEIKSFLHKHAVYSLSLSPVPSDSTFLEEFLLTQKKGFCVHFATAGTLLFRMYGIPARYVSGYTVSPKDLKKDSDGMYTCEIPDSKAHAWTEIYIGEGGWVPVDLTPASGSSQTTAPEPILPDEKTPDRNSPAKPQDKQPTNTETTGIWGHSSSGSKSLAAKIFSVLLSCIFVFFALFMVLCIRRSLLFKRRMGYFARNHTQCCLCVFRSILKLWQIEFHIPSSLLNQAVTDTQFKEEFICLLPESEKNLFLELFEETESIWFGEKKPEKNRVRTFRHIYVRTRKNLLAKCSSSKRLYYIFILGL